MGGVGELRASQVAGDDAGAAADVKDCVWIGDWGMNDAVVSKSNEGEMLVMKAGVLCWAKDREIVSWRLEVLCVLGLWKKRR